jgi:DNA repair protein RadC
MIMRTPKQSARRRAADDVLILQALAVLEERAAYEKPALGGTWQVKEYLRLRLALYEREAFLALWLDAQNRLIGIEELFRGTLTQTSVVPREVVKSGLAHNAAGVILAHNHPSGKADPSPADLLLTKEVSKTLALVDIRLIDHFIVGDGVVSFAERGLL